MIAAFPPAFSGETQYVDLFPDWAVGFERVLANHQALQNLLYAG